MKPNQNNGEETNWPARPHDARRFLTGHMPGCDPVDNPPTDGDRYGRGDDPPVLVEPDLIEKPDFRAISLEGPRVYGAASEFSAFLDGTQELRIVNQADGIPIVWATVSAAVRERVDRRLGSWNGAPPIVRRRFYIPFRYVDSLSEIMRSDPRVIDTAAPDSSGNYPSRHPAALMEAAVQSIQREREKAELELARKWCETESRSLYVDGSLTADETVASSLRAVGVIKTHRRLYAEGKAFRVLMKLKAGERTSVFKVSPRSRYAVASWYVRLRGAEGRDALFGLVRIEAALSDNISARANEISRSVIAEGAPLSLPDGRWDKMAYGIRHTEEFLRAIS